MKTLFKTLIVSLLSIAILFVSCSKDEPINTVPEIENQVFTIEENNFNFTIGTVVATDADSDDLTFSIESQSVINAVSIDATLGVLSIADETVFDFEVNQQITATVKVTDGELENQAIITINITDVVDQAPIITPQQVLSIDENPAENDEIGTVTATDPQNLPITFSIVSESHGGNYIAIDANTGKITVTEFDDFNFEKIPTFTAVIEASNGTISVRETVTINLNNISPSTNGLVARYTFNAITNGQVADDSGNGHTATFLDQNNLPQLVTGFDGKANSAADMETITNQLSVTIPELAQAKSYSLTGYFKVTDSQNSSFHYEHRLPNQQNQPSLLVGSNRIGANFIKFPNNSARVDKMLPINTWHHFAFCVSGEDVNIYIDGVLELKTTVLGPFFRFDAQTPLIVCGASTIQNRSIVDNFAIYNRVLTLEEVKLLTLEEE